MKSFGKAVRQGGEAREQVVLLCRRAQGRRLVRLIPSQPVA